MARAPHELTSLAPQKLAFLFNRLKQTAGELPGDPIPRRARADDPTLLSFAQERLWFLDRLDSGSVNYDVPGAIDLVGPLNRPALARSLAAIVARHEVLRTTFHDRGGEPVQVIGPPWRPPVPLVDLAALPEVSRERCLGRLTRTVARHRFDLERGPLLVATCARLGPERHRLLLVLHHVVADARSVDILFEELAGRYGSLLDAEDSPPLPPLEVQYADFALWQRERLAGEALETALAYWRNRLADLEPLVLRGDRQPGESRTGLGGRCHFTVPQPVVQELNALCQEHRTTLFTALLVAFGAFLSRYTRETDIAIAAPAGLRERADLERLIGCFVNTVVLRVDYAADPSFEKLLALGRETVAGALRHQELPFEKVVQSLAPERVSGANPLARVMLSLESEPRPKTVDGLRLRPRLVDNGTSKLDLLVAFRPIANRLEGYVEYGADLFDATTARRMTRQLCSLLASLAAAPGARVSGAGLVSPAERHQIAIEWSGATSPGGGEASIPARIHVQARRTPDAVAAVAGGASLSYRELDARASRVAGALQARGVRLEERVAVCLTPSLDLLASVLGVLGAGAAYVPLDPGYPSERLELMMRDSGARVVITRASCWPESFAAGGAALFLDGEDLAEAGSPPGPERPFPLDPPPEGLAYVIYTSGSTGRPKGVGIRHRSAGAFLDWALDAFSPEELGGVLAATSVCFDLSVFELFAPLAAGGCVFLSRSVLDLPSLAARHRVRLINTVPSVAAELLPMSPLPPSVRTVVLAGEPLGRSLAARVLAEAGVDRLLNLYGPTEDTTYSTGGAVPPGETAPTVGRPLRGSRAWVMDPRLRPQPLGAPGELVLGGAGLGRGYLGRPALTSEGFVPDPSGATRGGRLYRTGDLARWLPGGELELLGRLDQQVKVRGFRIELGEVEAALARLPEVRAAAAGVWEAGPADRRLVAYVVTEPGRPLDALALRDRLGSRLPRFIIPSECVVLDELPRTPNGKLDRRALPAPERPDAGAVPQRATPLSPVEAMVAEVWADVLGCEEVDPDESFFAAGGHSLLATRLVTRLNRLLGCSLSVRDVFDAPTVAALARLAEGRAGGGSLPIGRADRRNGAPLSFAQERLWFLDRLEPGGAAYNLPTCLRLSGPLDLEALGQAFARLERRHEALRTVFVESGGRPLQVVLPASPPPLPVIDLSGLASPVRDAEAHRRLREEAARGFDLEAGPLMRLLVLKTGNAENLLSLNVHHVAADGWSLGIVLREVGACYSDRLDRRHPALPELAVQYGDYALWQRRRATTAEFQGHLEYWRGKLEGAPPELTLPLDRARPRLRGHRGERCSLVLAAEEVRSLAALGHERGATLFMTLLAAFEVLLSRLSGQEDLVVGTPVAGRDRPEVEDLVGMFLNSLALRTDLGGNPTFEELLARVRETALEAYAHREVPFEHLLSELSVERDLSRTPLFQVFFNLLNFPLGEVCLEGVETEGLGPPLSPSKFDLAVYLEDRAGGLGVDFVYDADLFDRPRMEEMLDQYRQVLAHVVADPASRIRNVPLLTPAAAALLPDPTLPLRQRWEGGVPGVFLRWARRDPDRVAAVDRHGSVTYGAVERWSAGLAGRLAGLGVGRGDVVAVYGHRSAPLVWAVLGVLRSGAAFFVLDPEHPPSRLVSCLRQVPLGAWVALEEAGSPAPELAEFLAASPHLARIELAPRPRPVDRLGVRGPADAPSEPELGPDDLACVGFTSGSTGAPKGVLGRHGPLAHFIPWQCREFELGADDRFSALSGLSHDPLQRDLFTPLQTGGAVVFPEPGELLDASRLASTLASQRVTVSHLTPALAKVLCQAPGGTRLEDLRRAFLVGDVLTRRDVDRLTGLAPRVSCVNFFGATETQRAVGYLRVGSRPNRAPEVLPLGRGTEDVQLLVVADGGQLAGIGEVGEIWVRSPHLAGGYLGDPELTARRFVANPFTGDRGDRVYRTGDLGRFLPGGEVVFVGRADRQVKVRGFRVELGEVEAVIGRHPGVRETVVVELRDPLGEGYLAAYVVPRDGGAPAAEDLRRWVRDRLPGPMVPATFVPLRAIPLTPNRKVDRRALPEPGPGCGLPERSAVAPRTPTEELVLSVWQEVLGVEGFGVEDDFFELGGHSLRATQVIGRLRSLWGVELPIRRLFEAPTVGALAAALDKASQGPSGARSLPLEPVPRPDGKVPLSFAQERLWFLDRLYPETGTYNVAQGVQLRGPLHLPALQRALGETVSRHETLRTRFLDEGGEPRAYACPAGERAVALVDLAALPDERARVEARRAASREAVRPFNLARGSLLRTPLFRLAPEEHLLLVVVHHIACDGWSLELLVREVTTLYGAFSRSKPSPLGRLPVQYADFAAWQRSWLQEDVVEEKLRYWSRSLEAATPALPLPFDRPRPPVRGQHGGIVATTFPEELTAGLRALARRRGATLYMVLVAALQGVLARSTGEDDVSVGAPVAGRTHPQVEELIGLFVNTLVLRTHLGGDPPFEELVDRVRAVCLAAYRHQDLPFEKVVERVAPDRTLSRSPLFQVLCVLHNVPRRRQPAAGLALEPVELDRRAPKFDLSLAVAEDGARLGAVLEYDAEIFDRTTAIRMLNHLTGVLRAVASAPDARLSALSLLSAAERAQVAAEWNDTAAPYPAAITLPELFEAQAEATPDAVAVVAGGAALSYRELASRSAALARALRRRGVGPEVVVAVALDRSLDLMVALLGILEAGGAYLPLDSAQPAERLDYVLADARVRHLVTAGDRAAEIPRGRHATLRLDRLPTAGGAGPAPPRPHLDSAHLAYVIYTSGSTGRPKGVMSRHGSIVNRLLWMVDVLPMDPGERVLQKTPLSFDVSVWEIFAPLVAGGCVVMARPEGHRDSRYLAGIVLRERIITLHFVPSMLEVFLEEESFEGADDLRRVIASGEALTPELVRAFHGTAPAGTTLYNLYGPTEAAVDVLWWRCRRDRAPGVVPLGRPIANTDVRIRDRWGRQAGIGVVGELAIGGRSLARGYLARPSLTAERFLPDPEVRRPGRRLYLTGDLARTLATGEIEFLGRLDHQVKVRGVRVELGEIEATLVHHPSVGQAAALVRELEPGHQRLLGCLVPEKSAGGLAVDEVRRFVAERLPDYMVPPTLVVLDRLPLTPSGKIDRRALASMEETLEGDRDVDRVAPSTPVEEVLAAIWCDLLGVDAVGVHDHFFNHLGGHSLLATRVISRIRKAFRVELPLRELFEAPTITTLAARVEEARAAGRPAPPPVVPAPRGRDLPLSFAQQRLWFLDRFEPTVGLYNMPLVVRVEGALDLPTLAASLTLLATRHETLRTEFPEREGLPLQEVLPPRRVPVPVIDLSALPEPVREEAVLAVATGETARPFEIASAPPWRVAVLRLTAVDSILFVAMHHLITDGWSMDLLMRDAAEAYRAARAGEPPSLPELAVQYADYAVWQRRWLRDEVLDADLAFWRDRLGGAPPLLELPTDRPRPPAQSFAGGAVPFRLDAGTVSGLRSLARHSGATLFMVLAAVFQSLLARLAGAREVSVGTPVAGRSHQEIENLVGFFVNTLVLRLDLGGDPNFPELLERERKVVLDAHAHQDLPFERLVEELAPLRSLSHSPLFQVMIALQNARRPVVELPDLVLERAPIRARLARFDLTLWLEEGPEEEVAGILEYATALFDESTALRLVGSYERLLAAVVAEPDRPLAAMAPWTPAERHQVLVEWAGSLPAPGREPEPLPRRFAATVEATPDAVAVVQGTRALTFRALDCRAVRLASRLRRAGTGPGVRVGIALGREADLPVALLAILRTGAAYVPIDPGYPKERIRWVLRDSGIAALVTRRDLVERLPPLEAPVIAVGEPGDTGGSEEPGTPPAPDLPCYVIYTSGSTGRPKGVEVSHRNLATFLSAMGSRPGSASGETLVAVTSLAFDIAALEIFLPLVAGGSVVLADEATAADGAQLGRLVARSRARILQATPATWKLLLQAGWRGEPELRALCGGEELPAELASEIASRVSEVWNLYGPTETTVWSSVWRYRPGSGVSIGRPIPGTRVAVVDLRLRPVPTGAYGELVVAGAGVARGYLGRPGLTAERFVPDPLEAFPGARGYRTGDLVRWRAEGELEFHGRLDHQVKIRGFRIEPAEVERALRAHPGVRDAAVVAAEGRAAHRVLVAYAVPAENRELDASALRPHLRDLLPEYMVPTAYVVLPELPLTPNGKLDRAALPAPEGAELARASSFVAPATATEVAVAAVWAEVLGIERVSTRADFFELGGHSLLATAMMSRIRERLGVELPLRRLFETPALADLARAVDAELESGSGPVELPELRPDPARRFEPFPLTDVQQAYWIGRSDAFELGRVATHGYVELESDDLDVERLEKAWRRLVDRHDMLRAVILPDGRQRVLERVEPYRIERLDLRHREPAEVERELFRVREELSHQVLDAGTWPLFELRASLLDGGRTRLHVSSDLLIYDAWSGTILLRELEQLYRHPETELEALEITFRDYVLAEGAVRDGELHRRSRSYWRRRLEDLPPAPELPVAVDPAALEAPRFSRREAVLDAASWGAVRERARGLGVTPSLVLLAAFGEVLAAWSKSPRFTLNLTLFHRLPLHPQVGRLVGDFTSLTLLAMEVSPEAAFEERVRRIQERLWRDLDHRYLGGVGVLRELTRARGGSRSAAMPVVFTSTLGLDPGLPPGGEGLLGELVYGITQTPQVWLDHQVAERRDGSLGFNWDAVEDLFPSTLLDAMFNAYRSRLEDLAARPGSWVERPRVTLPAADLAAHRALGETAAPRPSGHLHDRLLARAAETPDALAVVGEGRRLSYRELVREAHRLGRHLRRLGAVPGRLVAVVMDKGWEQVVAALGILQSGAAYLPVSASLPEERRRYLLEAGEVSLALTIERLAGSLEWPSGVTPVAVDGADVAEVSDAPLDPAQDPDDLAYVIFTSGSTGTPKGVAVEHRSALNTVLDVNRRFGVGPRDRMLAVSSLSFDLSVYDVFGVLSAGGAVVIPEPGAARDPDRWSRWIAEEGVTLWNSVPALAEMLASGTPRREAGRLRSLRLALLSGDWIPLALPDRLRELVPGIEVVSLGGATEAAIWSILYQIGEVAAGWRSIPYGRPMTSQTFAVLDGGLAPRPLWVAGELFIGGAGLARGYWREPRKTAERFVPGPDLGPGERLYRTGDLGRLLPDGTIEFLGREDLQVKISGHRIELGEVEAALGRLEGVEAAVAVAVGEPPGGRRLVAYVVPAPDGPLAPPVAAGPRGSEPATAASAAVTGAPSSPPSARALRTLELKLSEPGLRRFDASASVIPLEAPERDDTFLRPFRERRTHRSFLAAPTAADRFRELLQAPWRCRSELSPEVDGVELYAWVRAGRVDGLAGGLYRYEPQDDRLEPVAPELELDPRWYAEVNRPVLAEAGFALFVVAASGRAGASEVGLLAAGELGQHWMEAAPAVALGLCPIGAVEFSSLAERLGLPASAALLHSLLGGPVASMARPPEGVVSATVPGSTPAEEGAEGPDPEPATDGSEGGRERVSREALGRFLAGLVQVRLPGASLPKYRYPSAGDLYPVQSYVWIAPGGVEGIEPGGYYHDPKDHRLVSVGAPPDALRPEPEAPVTLFLVARPAAIEPVYGADAEPFSWVEAGYVRGLLAGVAAEAQLDLRPQPNSLGAGLHARFALEADQHLCACLSVTGRAVAAARPEAPIRSGVPGAAPAQVVSPEAWLRERLAALLPDYMVPSAFVLLDRLPLTPNGKVDRRALPDPARPQRGAAPASTAPRTEMERSLVGLWCSVLGLEKVGVEENFFAIGGNSVSLIQLYRRMAQELDREVSLVDLFEHPTVASQAAWLEGLAGAAPPQEAAAARVARQREGLRQQQARARERLAKGRSRG